MTIDERFDVYRLAADGSTLKVGLQDLREGDRFVVLRPGAQMCGTDVVWTAQSDAFMKDGDWGVNVTWDGSDR